jgi:hypothetical protein
MSVEINGKVWKRSVDIHEHNEFTGRVKSVIVRYTNTATVYLLFTLDSKHGGGAISGAGIVNGKDDRRVSTNHPSMQGFVNDAHEVVERLYPSDEDFIVKAIGRPENS